METNVFKITLSVIYNHEVTEDEIGDNLFASMKSLDEGIVCLHIDEIKKMKNNKNAAKNILKKIIENHEDKDVIDKDNYVEIKMKEK
jgi:hypothetical protein